MPKEQTSGKLMHVFGHSPEEKAGALVPDGAK